MLKMLTAIRSVTAPIECYKVGYMLTFADKEKEGS